MPIIAGNWKMNMTPSEAKAFTADLLSSLPNSEHEVMLFPPYPCLPAVLKQTKDSKVIVGAQNMHQEAKGAFTGEVSAGMLLDIGCEAIILGHSERRQYFHETDDLINQKVGQAIASKLRAIICVGETDKEREGGKTDEILKAQVIGCLQGISKEQASSLIIAYEPVWAIGTGKTATPDIAQKSHAHIRAVLTELYDGDTAKSIPLLYGGSMKPDNAKELLAEPDINGGLIGGASLKKDQFLGILEAADQ